MNHPAHSTARRQRAIVWSFVILVTSPVSLAPITWAQSVREQDPDAQSFTIVILPDTQIYCYDTPSWRNSSRKEVFFQMTEWIAENVDKENIVFVLHMGDIVTTYDDPRQWAVANKAMSRLDGAVPYCFTIGNHDLAMEGENIRMREPQISVPSRCSCVPGASRPRASFRQPGFYCNRGPAMP